MNYSRHIREAVEKAERCESKCSEEILKIEGMSGKKTRHLYNNLLDMEDARYLEIGCWKGSTLSAAMYKNKATIVAIDNFSEFATGNIYKELMVNITKFQGENTVLFLNEDCFSVDTSLLPKFNIYMYDGEHSEENHKKSLTHFYDCLDETFLFIVDDWNWTQVKEGTFKAIHEYHLTILEKTEIESMEAHDPEGYWNGVCLFVLQKPRATPT